MAGRKNKKRPKEEFNLGDFVVKNRPTIRAFVIFVVSLSIFFFILISHLLDRYFIYPFTNLVAQVSSLTLNLGGYDTSVSGTVLKSSDTSLNIGTGCNGLEAVIIFISAILAFPTPIKNKLTGLLIGLVGIFIINQTRVLGLFFVNQYASQYLDLAHTYIGQTYVIISGVALWILWAEKVTHVSKKNRTFPA